MVERIGHKRPIRFFLSLLVGSLLLTGCTRTTGGKPPGSGITPADLRLDYQEIYLDLVARAYQADPTLDLKLALGPDWAREELGIVLQAMLDKTPRSDSERLARLRNLAAALNIRPVVHKNVETGDEPADDGAWKLTEISVLLLLLLLILLAAQLARLKLFKPAPTVTSPYRHVVEPSVWEEEPKKPLIQFVTTYTLGDDRFDPSLTIENQRGKFLGEYGVGISQAVGTGKPKKVTAFEVWLFDKHDVCTVTQVLASKHAYHDEALRAQLAEKGDLVLARFGQRLSLETATLRVRARVLKMAYGHDDLPKESFFKELTLVLAVWQLRVHDSEDEAQPGLLKTATGQRTAVSQLIDRIKRL